MLDRSETVPEHGLLREVLLQTEQFAEIRDVDRTSKVQLVLGAAGEEHVLAFALLDQQTRVGDRVDSNRLTSEKIAIADLEEHAFLARQIEIRRSQDEAQFRIRQFQRQDVAVQMASAERVQRLLVVADLAGEQVVLVLYVRLVQFVHLQRFFHLHGEPRVDLKLVVLLQRRRYVGRLRNVAGHLRRADFDVQRYSPVANFDWRRRVRVKKITSNLENLNLKNSLRIKACKIENSN